MNNVIEKCKREFLEEYELDFKKEYFSDKENEELNAINYSKEDIDQFILLKMLQYTKSTNSSIKTIRNIVIFWFVLILLALIWVLYR
ncbi:hypothetical protein [Pseudobacteroides cellulosolvens]|uniref:Uncharacterized protein n=1 Tax=Pseudobacteroides cellulosolvens ATCC 35603 = DSM 2933 TaxID=398512 RepID=A0A0L6JRB7_9FIRM|nr:hypothetical protein [Pseudobacteroides cellulosolvens]KNY28324.1 hypothetical protein Bccel_3598 [Pseudobacteroides cellulosolvens ATCC 35603 = DSM 2933]